MANFPPPVQIQKKRGMGCFGCGCGAAILVVILLVALVVGGGYYLYSMAKGYTDTAPVVLRQTDAGDTVFHTADQKIVAFQNSFQQGQPASLHLNSDEINTLIAREPFLSNLRGHLFVTLKDNQASLQSSILLGTVETAVFPDRYLNGDATVSLNYNPQTKNLDVEWHGLHVKGLELPSNSTANLNQSLNPIINQKIQADPGASAFFARTQKLTIENGELIIETK